MIAESLLSIGLLIVVAKLAEGVLGRIGISSLVAYTAAGILLGPVIGLVEPDVHILIFLEIGIFVFFFLVGLDEIDIPGLVATIRGRHFVAATVSVIISILASLIVTSDMLGQDFSLGLEFDKALSLAGILSLSSLGLVAKVLADKGLLKELIGLRIFTVVIIAEVLALLVVGLTIGEDAGHTLSLLGMLQLLGQIAGFTIMIWIISSRVLPRVMTLLQRFLNVPQLFFGLLMGALFLVVVGGESIGLHGSLGALLFGAALSGLPNRLRQEFVPGMHSIADGLFIPLFFASAGLYLDLSFLDLPATIIIALLFVPMMGKLIASLIGTYMARLETPVVLSVGLMGKGVAEVALLLVLLESHVIGNDVFSLLVVIMLGYILLMPPIISLTANKVKQREKMPQPQPMLPSFARHALAGVAVRSVMDRTRSYPGPDVAVGDFLNNWTIPNQEDYLILDGGVPVGTVSLSRLNFRRRLLFWRRSSFDDTPLQAIMRRNSPQADPDELIEDALERMTDNSLTVIPVHDQNSGGFLGMVCSNEILELVALRDKVMKEAQPTDAEPAD